MKRPVSIPLWFCAITIILLLYIAFINPYVGELNREIAVTTLTNEHNTLGEFLVDNFNKLVMSGRADRQLEHTAIMNETELIKNDTKIIILMLKNGTN